MRYTEKSRNKILNSLGEIKAPDYKPYSLNSISHIDYFYDKRDKFIDSVKKAGGDISITSSKGIANSIMKFFSDSKLVIDTTKKGTFELRAIKSIDLTIIEALLGVAENGAVWINWSDSYPRALLTLSNNLAILLRKEAIVDNMSQAYEYIDMKKVSYGVFLSGPSKTADIEQSLVIGAHGAITTRVFLF